MRLDHPHIQKPLDTITHISADIGRLGPVGGVVAGEPMTLTLESDWCRVEDLARSSGMSTSAFHRKFHAVTALSPIRFQKQIRLHKSRLLLMTGVDNVATAGYQVGYDSSFQFNREYRRQFGLPPGRGAARIRGNAPLTA